MKVRMTVSKKHKKAHGNQQIKEPYYTIRYLFIFVTTLGKTNDQCLYYNVMDYSEIVSFTCIILYLVFCLASVTVYHIHKELVRPKLEHLVVYEVSCKVINANIHMCACVIVV